MVLCVVRPWGSLGVILHREDWKSLMSHPFQGLVVEIHLGQLDLCWIQRVGVNTKPVILGSDHDLTCFQIFDRLIGAPMTEFQLKRPSSERQSQELMAQATRKEYPMPLKPFAT